MRSEAGEVAGLRSSVGAGGWVRLVVAGFNFSHSGNYLGRMGRMREVRLPLALCVRSVQIFFLNGDVACRNRVDAVSRNGQRVATVSKKFDFSDTPRGVSDAVSGRVGTYRRVGERPTLRHSMVRGVRAS